MKASPRVLSMAALAAAAGGLGGCMQTSTYGTGEMPEMAIFRELSGGFGRGKKEAPIQYEPRAPLVMPPAAGTQLPAPVETAAAADAAWPVDPDQVERQRREFGDDTPLDDISPEEARRLRPLAALAKNDRSTNWNDDNHNPVYDVVDKKQRDAFRAAVDEAEGISPTRRYLTEPPDRLREPAATAPTEFEDIQRDRGNILTRLFIRG